MNSNAALAVNQVTQNSLPVIAGVGIPTDDQGRFSLNAIHRVSGGESRKRPSMWVQNQQAKELISEMEEQSRNSGLAPVRAARGGKNPGTYAHELLAVSYAGWISPKFQLQVNQAFLDYRTGKLQLQAKEPKRIGKTSVQDRAPLKAAVNTLVNIRADSGRKSDYATAWRTLNGYLGIQHIDEASPEQVSKGLEFVQKIIEGELLPRDSVVPIRPVRRISYSEASMSDMVTENGKVRRWANCGPANDPLEKMLRELVASQSLGETVVIEDIRGAIGSYNAMVAMIANDTELMLGIANHFSRFREITQPSVRATL